MVLKTHRIAFLMAMVGCLSIGLGILLASPPNKGKLELYEQNAQGQIIPNGANGLLFYNTAGPFFDFTFIGQRLDKNTSYTLIFNREPEVMLPARYQEIATAISNSGGKLKISDSTKLYMDLLAARILLIPTDQEPAQALTGVGKYLFGTSTINYDETTSELVCGGNQSPGIFGGGPQVGEDAIDFSLWGIEEGGLDKLTPGNQEQPLKSYTLSELLGSKPVLLVNGAFT